MRLSYQSIKANALVHPMHERTRHNGMTYGLSAAGYDVRLAQDVTLHPRLPCLGSTIEEFNLPNNIMGMVTAKSSWARRGVSVFEGTTLEPGWRGFLTLEMINHGVLPIVIEAGTPIAQVVFDFLDEPTEQPYAGKYQGQPARPVEAILEGEG